MQTSGFELVKQKGEEKGPFSDMLIILLKVQRVLTKFCTLIWLLFVN